MPATTLRDDRRSAVALLFAILAIPMVGLIGLAIDYGYWNQTFSTLQLAASGAALNAVKTAASEELSGQSEAQAVADGKAAGAQWFVSQVGRSSNYNQLNISTGQVQVNIKPGATTTATVTYDSGAGGLSVASLFGHLFGKSSYPLYVTATAAEATAPYLEVVMMLDNSSSMDLAATPADITNMVDISPCSLPNAYSLQNNGQWANGINERVDIYQCNYAGGTYDGEKYGEPACPVTVGSTKYVTYAPGTQVPPTQPGMAGYEGCFNLPKQNGATPVAGPPCSFACHWDGSKLAGSGNDLWATARQNKITLRLDLLKIATNQVLSAMQTDNIQNLNNLSVGIYTFNTGLLPIYPGLNCTPKSFGCEAGSDWSTAISDVGWPPNTGTNTSPYNDTGFQPALSYPIGANDTSFAESMNYLASNYVTPSGDGTTPQTPRKVMMLITDGMNDDSFTGQRGPMSPAACQTFKDMGYTVYVVYTPYYPVIHTYYEQFLIPVVEPVGSGSLATNLQACSSATGAQDLSQYYIEASNQDELTQALQQFLIQALNSPARFLN